MRTYLLDAYRKKKSQEIEREKERILKKLIPALRELSMKVSFKEVYVFGSLLEKRFSLDSDIDLGFMGLKDKEFFSAMTFLSDYIGRDVEIIQIERHRLGKRVLREGRRIFP